MSARSLSQRILSTQLIISNFLAITSHDAYSQFILQTKPFEGGFPLSGNSNVRTRVNKIEAVYERSRVNVSVKLRSTISFTRDPFVDCLYFILFNGEKFRYVHPLKLTRQWKPMFPVLKYTSVQRRFPYTVIIWREFVQPKIKGTLVIIFPFLVIFTFA